MTPEERRAEAERLAGPHKEGSTFLANCKTIRVAYADCDCERLNRVTAIVSALEDAEKAGEAYRVYREEVRNKPIPGQEPYLDKNGGDDDE
jgi:hypothetical protein